MFQLACSNLHHIENKNDFIESKKPVAKTNKDKVLDTICQKVETGVDGFNMPQKLDLQNERNT